MIALYNYDLNYDSNHRSNSVPTTQLYNNVCECSLKLWFQETQILQLC